MQPMIPKLTEQHIFYIEIREFDEETIIWSGYLSDKCKINESQIIFYDLLEKSIINHRKGKDKVYNINLFFLNEDKQHFGVYQFSAESFEIKEAILSLSIYEDDFDLSYFKIGLIKKYHQNKINFRDWCELDEEKKQDWLKVSYWIQQCKPLSLISSIVIDGRYIRSLNDFLCYIGEEVNGMMGYFGSSFGSLSDSLTGGIGCITVPLNITWTFFEESKRSFDSYEDFEYLIELLNKEATLDIHN
jgi:RNAse (barnase) inhibitor barstar